MLKSPAPTEKKGSRKRHSLRRGSSGIKRSVRRSKHHGKSSVGGREGDTVAKRRQQPFNNRRDDYEERFSARYDLWTEDDMKDDIKEEICLSEDPMRIFDLTLPMYIEVDGEEWKLKKKYRFLGAWRSPQSPPLKGERVVERWDRNLKKIKKNEEPKTNPAAHQAVQVGKGFYELKKIDDLSKDMIEHVKHDGFEEDDRLRWYSLSENGEPRDREKTYHRPIGHTLWTDEQIHQACVELELVRYICGHQYDIMSNSCQHFVLMLLRKILVDKRTLPIMTKGDVYLEEKGKGFKRLVRTCYEVDKVSRKLKNLGKRYILRQGKNSGRTFVCEGCESFEYDRNLDGLPFEDEWISNGKSDISDSS